MLKFKKSNVDLVEINNQSRILEMNFLPYRMITMRRCMRRMFQIRWRRWSTFVATWTSSWRPPVVLRRWGRISSMIMVFIWRRCSIFYSYGWPQAWRRSRHTFPMENEKMGKPNYGFLHKIWFHTFKYWKRYISSISQLKKWIYGTYGPFQYENGSARKKALNLWES